MYVYSLFKMKHFSEIRERLSSPPNPLVFTFKLNFLQQHCDIRKLTLPLEDLNKREAVITFGTINHLKRIKFYIVMKSKFFGWYHSFQWYNICKVHLSKRCFQLFFFKTYMHSFVYNKHFPGSLVLDITRISLSPATPFIYLFYFIPKCMTNKTRQHFRRIIKWLLDTSLKKVIRTTSSSKCMGIYKLNKNLGLAVWAEPRE